MTIALTNVLPPDEFVGATLTQPISFSVGSDGTMTLAGTWIWVRGEKVYDILGGGFASGWTGSAYQVNAGIGGFDFRLVPDGTKVFQRGEEIEVLLQSSDGDGAVELRWSFVVEGEPLNMSLYPMILGAVRDMDGGEDGLLYKLITLPGGLDEIWRTRMFDRASDVKDLYNPAKAPAAWLPWLKALVGLGQDLSFDPTEAQLRAILQLFPYLNKHKPSDTSLDYAIRMVTGNRFWIRDFFDLRAVVGEAYLTELLKGSDPNILDFPSDTPGGSALTWCTATSSYPCTHEFYIADLPEAQFPSKIFGPSQQYGWLEIVEWPADPTFVGFYRIDTLTPGTTTGLLVGSGAAGPNAAGTGKWRLWGHNSEFVTEIRLVDDPDGSIAVDRTLLKFFLNLTRPIDERIEITYIAFLDLFPVIGELEQWEMDGTEPFITAVGTLAIPAPDGLARIATTPAAGWVERSLAIRTNAVGSDCILHVRFMVSDDDNYFYFEIDWNTKGVELYKVVATTPTQLGSTVTLPDLIPGYEDVWRANVIWSGSGFRLQVVYDGETILDEVEGSPAWAAGGVEIVNGGGAEDCYITLVEVNTLPAEIERVGPYP